MIQIFDLVLKKFNDNFEHIFYCKVYGFPLAIVLITLTCLYINCILKFPTVKYFLHSIRIIFTKPNKDSIGDNSPLQSITTATLGTVGFGSIAGVAISVYYGGIGAIFWMVIFGLMGLIIKFCEISLGVKYREIKGKNIEGGPFYYIKKALNDIGLPKLGVILALIYAVCFMLCGFTAANLFQVNQNAMIFSDTFVTIKENSHILAIICTACVAFTLIGGAKYVSKVGEVVIPPLAIGYILLAILVILINYKNIIPSLHAIVVDAFSDNSLHGGIVGGVVAGSVRAMFCTEYGAGTSAIAHARAKTDSHIKAGFVGIPELLIVLFIAFITGLAIVTTGVYDTPNVSNGITMTRDIFLNLGGVFYYIFPFACFLLAITTVIAWGYYGEVTWRFIFKSDKTTFIFKILFLITVYAGSVSQGAEEIIRITEYAWIMLTVVNLTVLTLTLKIIKKDLHEYKLNYKK